MVCLSKKIVSTDGKVWVLFQVGGVGGELSKVPPMSRMATGNMGGGYTGASDMVNNGLTASQNQVSFNDLTFWWTFWFDQTLVLTC